MLKHIHLPVSEASPSSREEKWLTQDTEQMRLFLKGVFIMVYVLIMPAITPPIS